MSLTFGVNLDSTLGPLFVGFSFSCIIFGFLSMQAFTYYQRFPNDLHAYKTLVRTVVPYVWLHNDLHVILGSILMVRKG